MPLEVLLSEVLEVSLGEGDCHVDGDFLFIGLDQDGLAELAGFAVDFYPLLEELGEVGGVENLVLDGFGAVDHERFGDLGLSFLLGVLLDLGFLGSNLASTLFCGHLNIYY